MNFESSINECYKILTKFDKISFISENIYQNVTHLGEINKSPYPAHKPLLIKDLK
jgi:hypothetical protein